MIRVKLDATVEEAGDVAAAVADLKSDLVAALEAAGTPVKLVVEVDGAPAPGDASYGQRAEAEAVDAFRSAAGT